MAPASSLRTASILYVALTVSTVRTFQFSSICNRLSSTNSLLETPPFRLVSCSRSTSNLASAVDAVRSTSTPNSRMRLAMSTLATEIPSWSALQSQSSTQPVGSSLQSQTELRSQGLGSAHVQNTLRLFSSSSSSSSSGSLPKITLYRDHAGWCPYCQKTMLLIEEKEIPVKIELVPMRSYGDKPAEFLKMVPSGLLPAILVESDDGKKKVITESQVVMELLDKWHPVEEGYKQMLPTEEDRAGWTMFNSLARLERELFSWWCTLIFRPEGPRTTRGVTDGIMGMFENKKEEVSGAMKGFLDCLTKVDNALTSTAGPWFFGQYEHPTMIDFIYVSHVERMLASCAYWKGLNLRSVKMRQKYPGINAWLEAFEKRECYLAFKSDYYTHVMDIPPQYGPGYDGGFEDDRALFSQMINGKDGTSWKLPLPHDDPIQPLYKGPPLPLNVLESAGISAGADNTFEHSDSGAMAKASRHMAGWKLSGNGEKVSKFAARGGSQGARNPRKTFGAELADPYASPDNSALSYVDTALRFVCAGLLDDGGTWEEHKQGLDALEYSLKNAIPYEKAKDVSSSLAYLRDRVGVPRDLPLAAARQLRAHLNWAIDVISK